MKKVKYNLEKEFGIFLKRVNREFMYDRCREYRVRIRKDDDLATLCFKYLKKKEKMKPWDYPDDEKGNAIWLNPIINLEDKVAWYIVYEKANSLNKNNMPDESLKKLRERIKKTIKGHIEYVEEYDRTKKLIDYVKHPGKEMKKRREYIIENK